MARLYKCCAKTAEMLFKGRLWLCLLLCFSFSSAYSATYTSVGSGNWGSTSTWSPAGIPTSADNVIIEGGHTVTVNISNAVCATLNIGSKDKANATLSFNSGAQLTVTGTVTFGDNGVSLRTGALDMAYGGKLTCSNFAIQNFSSFTAGIGTVEFTGTSTLPAEFTDFHNLNINGGTLTLTSPLLVTGTLSLVSGTLASNSNLTMGSESAIARSVGNMSGRVQGTNLYDLIYTGNSKTMGPERTGHGLNDITVNVTSGQTITQDTTLTISSLNITSGTYSIAANDLNISKNLLVNGTLSGTANVILAGVNSNISGTGTIANSGSFSVQSGSKNILSGSNLTFSTGINIIGGITIFNNGTVNAASTAGIAGTVIGSTWQNNTNAVLNIAGPFLPNGTVVTLASGNTVNYNSTAAAQDIHATTYHHLTITKNTQTASLAGNITVNGNLSIISGTLDASTNNYSITLKGNFSNSGTFTPRSATVNFNGTAAQTISSATTFYQLLLNNTSGISLANNITVSGQLTFTNGKITTGSNKVILASGGNISGAGNGKYIYGMLEKYFGTGSNTAFTFAVGSNTSYLPLALNISSISTAGSISAKVTSGEHPQISSSCISSSGNINYYWTLSGNSISTGSYSAAFGFSAGNYDAVAVPADFKLSKYNSGWVNLSVSARTSTSISAIGISGFGDFVAGEFNPKIYTNPSDATVCAGDNTVFSVASTGSSLTYSWQESRDSGSSWNTLSTNSTYKNTATNALGITGVSAGMAGYKYRCIVSTTGSCAYSDTSAIATIALSSSFAINLQPAASQVCVNGNTSFSISASGAVSGYIWQRKSGASWSNISNGGIFSGATSATLSLTNVGSSYNGNQFRCIVTSNCGPNDTSSAATLSLLSAPVITSNPANVTSCEGANISFSVSASGDALTYQWEESKDGGSSWQAFSSTGIYGGATSATLTLSNVSYANNSYRYRCVVSGSCTPPVTSTAATLTLNRKPYIITQPSDVTIQYNTNRNATFSASGSGSGTISYQWQENSGAGWGNISNNSIYSGATTGTLAITNATISMDSHRFRCIVSGSCAPADTSAEAFLYISFHFTITTNTSWSTLSPTPTTTSTIEVKGGATLTVDVANAVCATLQLGRKPNPNGGAGTLTFNSGAKLNVLGPGRNIVLGDQNRAGSINMSAGGTLVCNGFIVDALGTWTPGTGTVEFTGVHTIPSNFTSFNNLNINSTVTLGANTTLSGNLNILPVSTLNTSSYTLSVPGNLTVDGNLSGSGAVTLSGSGKIISGKGNISKTGTISLNGNYTISDSTNLSISGTLAIASGITITNKGKITTSATGGITGAATTSNWINDVNATLNITGPLLSTGTLTASASGNTILYNGTSGSQAVKGVAYYNLGIDKTGQTANIGSATSVKGNLYLTHGTLAAGTNLTMSTGSVIERSAGFITGTIQGANTYNVNYTENSKTTGSELSGTGFQDFTVNLNIGETLYLDRLLKPIRNITINSGNVDVTTNNFGVIVQGNFINNGTFIPRAGTVTFSGTSAQTISGSGTTNFSTLIINNANGVTVDSAANIADSLILKNGVFAAGNNLTFGDGVFVAVDGGSMTGDVQGNHFYDITYMGSTKNTGAELSGEGIRNITMNLNAGQTLTLASAMNMSGNLLLSAGTLDVSTGNFAINTGGNFTNNAIFVSREGTVTFDGTSAQSISGSTPTTFNGLEINNTSGGVNLTQNIIVTDSLELTSGNLAAGTKLTMAGGSAIEVNNGTLGGTIQGNNAYDILYTGNTKNTGAELSGSNIRDITVQMSSSQTVTLASAMTLSRNLLLSSGTLDVSASNYAINAGGNFTNNATFTSRAGTVTLNGTSAQNISGSTSTTFYNLTLNNDSGANLATSATVSNSLSLTKGNLAVGTNTLTLNGTTSKTGGTLSSNATGTVIYNQSSDGQNILTADYGNLVFSNYKKTLPADTIGISGTFTTGTASGHTITGNTISFDGSTQNIPTFTYNNIEISGGTKTISGGNITVNGTLDFSGGKIATGSSKVIISSTGNIAGADASNYIYGNLQKYFGTGSNVSRVFEIGNSTNYLPVTLDFASITTAGNITAFTTNGDHPQIASSCLDASKTANRYWSFNNSGTVFTTYSATVNFAAADVDSGANTGNFRIAVYNSGWSNPNVSANTATSTSASGISSLGDLQAGQAIATIITAQPDSVSICAANNVNFSVSATGHNLSYQWQISTNGGSSWTDVSNNLIYSGATSSTLNISPATILFNNYKYRCLVSAPCTPKDTSASAILKVNVGGQWLGTYSTSWLNPLNWCGGIPDYTADVVIPAGVNFMPETGRKDSVNNLTIASGAELTLTNDLSIFGDLYIYGTIHLGNNKLTLKGTVTGNGTIITDTSANLEISGIAANTAIPGSNYKNVIINRSNGASLQNDLTISGTLTLSKGNLSLGAHTLEINGDLISTSGNLSTTSSSSIIFGGNEADISIPSGVENLDKLVINNANGISLNSDITVADSIYLMSGKLYTGNYDLSISSGGHIWGYDSTKYIVTPDTQGNSAGKLIQYISNNNTNVVFPVGTENNYSPAKIKLANGATADNFSVRVFDKMLSNGNTGNEKVSHNLKKTWMIEEGTNGGSDATIELGWTNSSQTADFDSSETGVSHYKGSNWNHDTIWAATTNTQGIYWQNRSGITDFSPFSVVDANFEMAAPIQIKAYLECAYVESSSALRTNLNEKNLIPLSQPYSGNPWYYNGTDSVLAIPNADVVDWVLVELRNNPSINGANSSTIAARKAGFILKDGSIVSTDGSTPITFNITSKGNYFIVLHHRTHLPVISAAPVKQSQGTLIYDFTTSDAKAYGTNSLIQITPGKYGLPAGRIEYEATPMEVDDADLQEAWDDRNKLGYFQGDCSMDGQVDADDRSATIDNYTRQAQIP